MGFRKQCVDVTGIRGFIFELLLTPILSYPVYMSAKIRRIYVTFGLTSV